uniref:histone-lysine N-methyltransferase SETMAR-like n=1 Tax=Myxine glutinosa TaxID=7769 RepID=UPI00358EB2A0
MALPAHQRPLASVVRKMATPQHKAFCVLHFSKTESVIAVQRAFQRRFGIDPPMPKSIHRWYRQFEETGCLCKGKSPGRPHTSEENVRRIQESFLRSPRKSTRRASRELAIPHTTVWRVLRRRLILRPYRLQLVQALRTGDKGKRVEFSDAMLQNMEDDSFLPRLIFSDEATFHLSGKVNRHNVRIWGLENPHETVEHERDSPKVNVFCAVSQIKVYGPFFFEGKTVTGQTYLEMLQNWLFPQLNEDSNDFIFQQDGPPPHCNLQVRRFLNDTLPQRWIGRMGPQDLALHSWPPRSPDITPCDFLLWGYVNDRVFVPPLATNLDDLKNRITAAVTSVKEDTLRDVWDEFNYRLDVVLAAGGGHIEHL